MISDYIVKNQSKYDLDDSPEEILKHVSNSLNQFKSMYQEHPEIVENTLDSFSLDGEVTQSLL